MKTIELQKITDIGRTFQQNAEAQFGSVRAMNPAVRASEMVAPLNDYDRLVAGLQKVSTNDRLPNARLIPVQENLEALRHSPNKVFGIQVDKALRAAVITERSPRGALHLAYLAGEQDILNPADPVLTDFQKSLLRKMAALHQRSTGTDTVDGIAAGAELGHQQLGIAGVLLPALLLPTPKGEHIVHEWAESVQGVGAAVTDPDAVAIYDLVLPTGQICKVRERAVVLTSGILLDHPHFHESADFELKGTPQEFAAGLGLLAVESQLGIGQVQKRVMENLKWM